MTPSDIIELLKQHDAQSVVSAVADGPYPHVVVKAEGLTAVAAFLKTRAATAFRPPALHLRDRLAGQEQH